MACLISFAFDVLIEEMNSSQMRPFSQTLKWNVAALISISLCVVLAMCWVTRDYVDDPFRDVHEQLLRVRELHQTRVRQNQVPLKSGTAFVDAVARIVDLLAGDERLHDGLCVEVFVDVGVWSDSRTVVVLERHHEALQDAVGFIVHLLEEKLFWSGSATQVGLGVVDRSVLDFALQVAVLSPLEVDEEGDRLVVCFLGQDCATTLRVSFSKMDSSVIASFLLRVITEFSEKYQVTGVPRSKMIVSGRLTPSTG